MFDPTGVPEVVLGIDPGLSRCGYGVVRRDGSTFRAVAYGVIRTPPSDELPVRLATLLTELEALLVDFPPAAVAVERVLFQVNTRTAMSVGQASGLALALAGRAGIPVVMYSPNEVKLAVAGDGGAGKEEVQQMVTRLLKLAEPPRPPDAADALALALCHWWRAPHARRRRGRRPAGAAPGRGDRRRGGPGGRTGEGHRMIGSVRGTVVERTATGEVLVEVGGVGYRVHVPASALPTLHPADTAFLFTHLHVREDAMVLYGFPTRDERDTFEALIGTTGVGPKLALAMLSVHSPSALRRALLEDDLAALTSVPGVGKRTAQRLLVELKARLEVPELDLTETGGGPAPRAEVRAALAGLGYGPDEVRDVLAQLPEGGTVEDLLREALKLLAVTRA